ncbi:hypothetical protein CYY_006105 [Polysphondylium violaceum]|uniref:RNA helicase n=1 Tax=Polysphondylium violaceum TaxID=133409 RepID=A0A8J4PS95_9MYCE|nr:hypothetical protein CYY_006105 [Polysphondylium violaceum]
MAKPATVNKKNVKVKNKNNLNKKNSSQADYLKGKKEAQKSYARILSENEGYLEAKEKAAKAKKKEEASKKREKRINNVVISDKLQTPSNYIREDTSFYKNVFDDDDTFDQDASSTLNSKKNDIDLNENYESNLFADMMDDFDGGDGMDELDFMDYNDDALVNEYGDNGYTNDDEDDQVDESYKKKEKKSATTTATADKLGGFPSIKSGKNAHVADDDSNVVSFEADGDEEDDEDQPKKKKKKSGSFQSFDLNKNLLKCILRKGFNVPTPIQRRTIPLIIEGMDVVAMARTGSGKTGAFVIPMIQKLGDHSTKVGVRAIILSPTRELAIQTYKVVKDFSHGTALRSCLIVGGDSMEDQFAELSRNPDVIIATPGRLMHHLQETGMSLSTVEYIVFDEADRLFEMGFSQQLTEIMSKLGENRQTLLFSATLPSLMAEFVRAGLHSPKLVRLDTETKISDQLTLSFYTVRQDEKLGVLLYLLKEIISNEQSTIIFTSTRYHVEYLSLLLEKAFIPNTYIHGYLDPIARKINLAKFRSHKVNVMVVTDLAARGIDIPLLDNVINFDFPPKEKIFVHRVGRVARAGRTGIAYSLVSPDEIPYMIDLHLYLGKKLVNKLEPGQTCDDPKFSYYGNIPQHVIDREIEFVNIQRKECVELLSLNRTIYNAHKKYITNRPGASHESNKRAKALDKTQYHPALTSIINDDEKIRNDFIQSLKAFRPPQTVLEMDSKKNNNTTVTIMKEKRKVHSGTIELQQKREKLDSGDYTYDNIDDDIQVNQGSKKNKNKKINEDDFEQMDQDEDEEEEEDDDEQEDQEMDQDEDDQDEDEEKSKATKYNVQIEESAPQVNAKKKTRSSSRDERFFISNTPSNIHEERALAITDKFTKDVEVNLNPDNEKDTDKRKKTMVWDKRKGNFVNVNAESDRKKARKLVRNEAGKLVEAKKSEKGYEEWKKKTKTRIQRVGEQENAKVQPLKKDYVPLKWRGNKAKAADTPKDELRDKHAISKNRDEKERKMRVNKTKGHSGKGKGGGFGGKGKGGGGKGGFGGKGKGGGGKGGRGGRK